VSEFMIKVIANGLAPWNYWIGEDWRWNNFDFTIVMLSFQEVAAIVFNGGSSTIRVLRLFRLARLLKLVNKIPKLQAIVSGLMAGVSSVKYIALLLFLVFYIFAVAGITFFSINDPFHFRTVPVALMTLFRAATLEDWTDIMYINMYGCDRYTSGMYYVEDKYYDKKTKTDIPGAFDGTFKF
jgi:voltage-gated sodium channel